MEMLVSKYKDEILSFTQKLIQTKSYTGREENIALVVKEHMVQLGYDKTYIDKVGNVIGVLGSGDSKILFDSHMDTVEVNDISKWTVDPFSGKLVDDKIYGCGSSDMKGALAATVYAGKMMKDLDLLENKTVYVVASVMEEDYDGEALHYLLTQGEIRPNYVVVCEPSNLHLALGHQGRALIKISVEGVSAHGSAPEKGVNAVYKMGQIITRVSERDLVLRKKRDKGSLALSKIESSAASLNAIPYSCNVYLDRRIGIHETRQSVEDEMHDIVADTDAIWSILKLGGKSWTGENVVLDCYLPPWEISEDHPFVEVCKKAYRAFNDDDIETLLWDFSTNGVASAGKLHIPTIGYGPGNPKLAHKVDEYCKLSDILKSCEFYVNLVKFME